MYDIEDTDARWCQLTQRDSHSDRMPAKIIIAPQIVDRGLLFETLLTGHASLRFDRCGRPSSVRC